ncbi:MAG: TIGR04222 domain-containing membrane protein [Pseudomonadota bacterium]
MQLFETWTGPDFLAFYVVMLVTCIGIGLWLPALMRPEGRGARVEDPEELALLAGGPQRHALAVLADLYVQGALDKAQKTKLSVAREGVARSSAGAAVLRKVGAFSLSEAMRTLKDHAKDIEQRLVKRNLLLSSGEATKMKLLSVLPYAALIALGLYRWNAGEELGEPTGYLLLLIGVTILCMVARFATGNARTQSGNAVLKKWKERSSRLKRAPKGEEVSLAVGLFGAGVLAGTPYSHLLAMKQAASAGDAGSGGDGGDGGGGCGGGCGGCGGCGG